MLSRYTAQYPVLRTAQSAFTLYVPGRPVQSNTVSTSLGSIQPYATINMQRLRVHISTSVYSWLRWNNVEWKNLPKVLTPQHRIWNRVLLVESLKLYPLTHCALYYTHYTPPGPCTEMICITWSKHVPFVHVIGTNQSTRQWSLNSWKQMSNVWLSLIWSSSNM